MNEIKNQIKKLYDDGLCIEAIIRSLPTTIIEARNLIREMKQSGELAPRSKADHTRRKIKALLEKGYNRQEICAELAITMRTVGNYCIELGHKGRPLKNYNPRKRSQKSLSIMEELKKGNTHYSEIAREYGVSRQYVFRLAQSLK